MAATAPKLVPSFGKKKSFAVLKNVTNIPKPEKESELKQKEESQPKIKEVEVKEKSIEEIFLKNSQNNISFENNNSETKSLQDKDLALEKSKSDHEIIPQNEPQQTIIKKNKSKPGNEKVVGKSLTDSQYESLFDAVAERARTGDIAVLCDESEGLVIDESEDNIQPNDAASQFAAKVINDSPQQVKATNEVTPEVSPIEQQNNPPLLKPTKEKKDFTSVPKRKSLGYKTEVKKEKVRKSKSPNEQKTKSKETKKAPKKKSMETKDKEKVQKEKEIEKIVAELKRNSQELLGLGNNVNSENVKWVQCSHCNKWRLLPSSVDIASLDDNWMCEMNEDIAFSSCFVPEEDWDENSQDSIVYVDFSPGTFVWARMTGYPMWPAVVDFDPDCNLFCEKNAFGEVTHYHVTFLDENVSRAWVTASSIEKLKEESEKELSYRLSNKFSSDIKYAYDMAVNGLKVPVNERIAKFGFLARFNQKEHCRWTKGKKEKKKRHSSNRGSDSTEKIPKKIKRKSIDSKTNKDKQDVKTNNDSSECKEEMEAEVVQLNQSEEEDLIKFICGEDDEVKDENYEPPLSQVTKKRSGESSQELDYVLEF